MFFFKYLRLTSISFVFVLLFSCNTAVPEQHWQKGNLHTHSFWSDGDDFPEMIIRWYKDNDYQFIALSDHNTIATGDKWYKLKESDKKNNTLEKYRKRFGDWVESKIDSSGTSVRLKTFEEYKSKLDVPDSFLIIRSEEVTSSFGKKPVHINVTNIQKKIEPIKANSVYEVMQQTLDAVHAQRKKLNVPMFAHINHPNFGYGINTEDLKKLKGERFFELYNGHPAVNNEGDETHYGIETMWDLINISYYNERKPLLLGIATDDSHNYHIKSSDHSNTGRGWVMVNSKKLDPVSLIEAMEAGDFYSSSGVSLKKVHTTKKKLSIEVDSKEDVTYEIIFMGYQEGSENMEELKRVKGTAAEYVFEKNDLIVRAKINSNLLKENPYIKGELEQAWTQPIIVK
jgi:hypothetical protein